MKKALLRLARMLGGAYLVPRINAGVRSISSFAHWMQFAIQWGVQPNPEWYDHFLDQHWDWYKSRMPFSWERGIFNLMAMRQGARVLEVCCGDGFNAHHFYSIRAGKILSVDFDPNAIDHAKRNFRAPNVEYRVADIRTDLPAGTYDNVIWDAAIEHFTETEIASLMADIKGRLAPDGVLSGYTIVEVGNEKSHHEHEYEFKSKEDLTRFLSPHFKNVKVIETIYPIRHNLYFYAANGPLPLDEGWERQVVVRT
ncbi:MAG TPA: class I SAM-dependent methyltransferase [Burkholderiales bacterium]|jgi:SAM-dependent methyltransferase|nr:class I SAM-dependent methyltransferase [Burkholderiales bacterium]